MTTNTYKTNFGMDVSVQIIREENVKVKVIAPLYMRKEWVMDHCYSTDFSDHQIMRDSDFLRVMSRAYPPPKRPLEWCW